MSALSLTERCAANGRRDKQSVVGTYRTYLSPVNREIGVLLVLEVCPQSRGGNYVDSSRNRDHWGKTCNRLVKGKWLALPHPHEVARSNGHRSYIRWSGDTRTGQDGG